MTDFANSIFPATADRPEGQTSRFFNLKNPCEMEIEQWVEITITRSPVVKGKTIFDTKEIIWQAQVPRRTYDAHFRWLGWIDARFTYLHPRHHVQHSLYMYDRKTGIDVNYNSAYWKCAAAKGQVTKMRNAMDAYVKAFVPTLYESDPFVMPAYLAAFLKLQGKLANLAAAEMALRREVETMRELEANRI